MAGTHIVRRQCLEVDFDGAESQGFALQTQILNLCEDSLLPALEGVFDRLLPTDDHWTIERLTVDVGEIRKDQLERDLVAAVTEAVERELRACSPVVPAEDVAEVARLGAMGARPQARLKSGHKTRAAALQDAFVHFLESGVLPWWIELPAGQSLEDAIVAIWSRVGSPGLGATEFVRGVLARAVRGRARRRLVRQFTPRFLWVMLEVASKVTADALRSAFETLAPLGLTQQAQPHFVFSLWETAFVTASSGQSSSAKNLVVATLKSVPGRELPEAALLDKLRASFADSVPSGQRDKPTEALTVDTAPETLGVPAGTRDGALEAVKDVALREPASDADAQLDLDEGEFVRCAGIVLLHPFLPRLFSALGIAHGDAVVQPERALSLLHFLATGHRTAPEYDLLLPKVLCGMAADEVVSVCVEPTTEEQAEAEALLGAVIGHWEAVGSLSLDGLRGSYLVRPGKLSSREGDYLLQVEPRGYDILLDRLPWGIGIVRLPWMTQTLWVEWRM